MSSNSARPPSTADTRRDWLSVVRLALSSQWTQPRLRNPSPVPGSWHQKNDGRAAMTSKVMGGLIAAASLVWIGMVPAVAAPFMIVGNDEKIAWDDEGKL